MKSIFTLLFTLVAFCCAAGLRAAAPPPNDDCPNAIGMTIGSSLTGTTVGSNPDPGIPSPCAGVTYNPGTGGVWYKFSGDGSTILLTTCGGGTFDTQLMVFEGGCGTLSCVTANNNDPTCAISALRSTLSFTTSSGHDYLVLVSGIPGERDKGQGEFTLSLTRVVPDVSLSASAPCVDDCIVLTATPSGIPPRIKVLYVWTPCPGGSAGVVCDGTSIEACEPGTYIVTITDTKGGYLASDTIEVLPCVPCPPVFAPAFTTTPAPVGGIVNICLGSTVYFNTSTSVGADTWLWDFGDGYTSTTSDPSHQYNDSGVFTVTLYASNDCEDTVLTTTVQVDELPGPDIQCPSVVCAGDTAVYFTSVVCSNYVWTVGGGTIVSSPLNSSSIMVIWGAGTGGFGTVSLEVPGCGGFCNQPTVVPVPIVPSVMPISGPTVLCKGDAGVYTVPCVPGNVYTWSVPSPGTIISGQGTHEILVDWPSTYTGSTTISISYVNTLAGCSGTGTLNVVHLPVFGVGGPAKLCPDMANTSFPFTSFEEGTFTPAPADWIVITPAGDTIVGPSSSTSFDTYDWSDGPGIYTVVATTSSTAFCNTTATTTVEVVAPVPAPAGISGPLLICSGGTGTYTVIPNIVDVNYTWNITGGSPTLAFGNSVVITWGPSGGTVSVTQQLASDPFCISPPTTITVAPYAPVALPSITGPASVCKGSTGNYSFPGGADPTATYTWSVTPAAAGTITVNSSDNIDVNWLVAGSAVITLTVASPCTTQTTTYNVTVNPLPFAKTGPPATICLGESVTLGGITLIGHSYSWTPAAGLSNASISNPVASPSVTTTYTLTETNTITGCTASKSVTVTVNPLPAANAGAATSICEGDVAVLGAPAVPGSLYEWTPSTGLSSAYVANPSAYPSSTTTYTLTEINSSTGCRNTGTVTVTVNPEPVVSITSSAPACKDAPVSFFGSAGIAWAWDFGDPGSGVVNNTSSLQNPSHTYSSTGTKTVQLTVTDANGCSATTSILVDIKPLPNALLTVTGPQTTCDSATITLYAINSTGYSYLWTPSLPPVASNTVTYNSPTTYTVQVTNGFGCSAISNPISTSISCDTCSCTTTVVTGEIDFTAVTTSCTDVTFTLTPGTNLTGVVNPLWYFDDGSTAPVTGTTITHTYTSPGLYDVQIIGGVPGVNTCAPFDSILCQVASPIHIVSVPLVADFFTEFHCNAGVIETDFTDLSQYFASNNIDGWKWYLDGSVIPFSTLQHPDSVALSPGSHTVTLVISSSNTLATCTVTLPVNVPTPAVPSFTAPAAVCENTAATFTNTSTGTINSYLWNFGAGTSTAVNPSFTYGTPGTFAVILTIMDINGCTITSPAQTVTVNPAPAADAGTDVVICPGIGASIGAPAVPGNTYSWSPSTDLSPSSTVSDPVASPVVTTIYTLTETNSFGCQATDAVTVWVTPAPVANTGPDVTICEGSSAILGAAPVGGNTYSWSPSTDLSDPSSSDPIAAPSVTTTYTLTEVDPASGCTATNTVTVTVVPVPVADAGADISACTFVGGYIGSGAVAGFSYAWSPAAGLADPSASFTFANPASTTVYTLTVTDDATGCTSTDMVTVTVNPLPPALISGDLEYCEGDPMLLTTVGGYFYAWYFDNVPTGDGFVFISGAPFVSNPSAPLGANGDIYVVVTDPVTGCSASSDKVSVEVHAAPVAPIIAATGASLPLCEGDKYKLEVTNPQPDTDYLWSTGQTGTGIGVINAGEYSVTATNKFGCTSVSNVLTINPVPDISCVPSGCYEICDTVTSFTVYGPAGYAAYAWQEDAGSGFVTISTSQDLVITHSGVYHLVVTNSYGCSSTSEPLNIDFIDCDCVLLATATGTGVSCVGATNGTATVTTTGGTAPYSYTWSTVPVQTTATATGLGAGTYTVTVTDAHLCTATATVTISVACGGTTFTQGGWGAVPHGANPGVYMTANFAGAFPSGLVVGCTKTLTLTNAAAVTAFLPSGGAPSVMTINRVNPGGSYNNTLAGQVVALKLAVVFDAYDPAFSSSPTLIGDQIITSGTFAGWTVSMLLAEAEKKLGGCASPYSASQLNAAATAINENYDNGTTNNGYLTCPCPGTRTGNPDASAPSAEAMTGDLQGMRFEAFPNPFVTNVTFRFTLNTSTFVTLEVFDVSGKSVGKVFSGNVTSGEQVTAEFNGNSIPQGVYFYKLTSTGNVLTGKLVMIGN